MSLEISQLYRFSGDGAKKRGGGKNKGFSHYVIENIRSEIAILGLAIMCMKKMDLSQLPSYLYEKAQFARQCLAGNFLKFYLTQPTGSVDFLS
jgi:hypothetical protein